MSNMIRVANKIEKDFKAGKISFNHAYNAISDIRCKTMTNYIDDELWAIQVEIGLYDDILKFRRQAMELLDYYKEI